LIIEDMRRDRVRDADKPACQFRTRYCIEKTWFEAAYWEPGFGISFSLTPSKAKAVMYDH
jgi:hypothetical protein